MFIMYVHMIMCATSSQRATSSIDPCLLPSKLCRLFFLIYLFFSFITTGFLYAALAVLDLLCRPDWPQTHRDLLHGYWDQRSMPTSPGLFFFFLNSDSVLLCSSDWPEIHYIDQPGLELTKFHLPLLPKIWDQKCVPQP